MNIVDKHIGRIKELCEKHKGVKSFVLGSVLTPDFEESSDIDFLVEFADVDL